MISSNLLSYIYTVSQKVCGVVCAMVQCATKTKTQKVRNSSTTAPTSSLFLLLLQLPNVGLLLTMVAAVGSSMSVNGDKV
jgi:hypothetical protein